jgi:arylsulfatase
MRLLGAVALVCALAAVGLPKEQAQQQTLNILVIMGDDIGMFNISAYNLGMMGYKTPNIDRIAQASALFTD